MTQADFGVALMLFSVVSAFTLYSQFTILRHERRKAARYPLFAVRDQLVLLVAEQNVSEDDPTFKFLYQNVSHLIPQVKPLTLRAIIEALETSTLRLENHSDQEVLDSLHQSNKEIRKVAEQFFDALLYILFARSWFVWLSAHGTHSSFALASTCRKFLSRLFQKQSEAYRWYQRINRMNEAIAV